MQHLKEVAQHRALVDEERVAALLENLPELLTSDEQERLRRCARVVVKLQTRAAEIGLEAARRHSTTDVEEFTAREAIGRYFMVLVWQGLDTAANENLIEM
jgi:hypothetical protein